MTDRLVCQHCGATGNDKGPWKNQRALNMHERHCANKHGETITKHPLEYEPEEEVEHPLEISEDEEDYEDESEDETDVEEFADSVEQQEPIVPRKQLQEPAPDVYETLRKLLKYWRMPKDKISHFVHSMKRRNLDELADFIELEEELNVGWGKTYRNFFLQEWAEMRGIEIPRHLEEEIYPRRDYRRKSSFDRYGRPLQSDNPASQLVAMVQAVKDLKEVLEPNEGEYSESDEIRDLQSQVDKLTAEKEKLEQKLEFEKMLKDTVEPLKDEIRQLKDEQKGRSFGDKVDNEIIETARGFRSTAQEIKDYLLTGAQRLEESQREAPPPTTTQEDRLEDQRLWDEAIANMDEKDSRYMYVTEYKPQTPVEQQGRSMERRQNHG
jgi:hypothetical protein